MRNAVHLAADTVCLCKQDGRANPIEIRRGPHIGKRIPCLLFTGAVKIRPHYLQYFGFRGDQLM